MKSIKLLVIALFVISWLPSYAYDFEVDGVYYNWVNYDYYGDDGVEVSNSFHGDYSSDKEISNDIPLSIQRTTLTQGLSYAYAEVTYKDENYNSYSGDIVLHPLSKEQLINAGVYTEADIIYVVGIGYKAFYKCKKLTSIDLSGLDNIVKGSESYYTRTGVNYIGSYAFAECTSLKTINVTGLEKYTNSIYVPYEAASIGSHAFENCYNLTDVDLSDFADIPYQAFNNCYNLESLSCSLCCYTEWDWITGYCSINDEAFLNCSKLSHVSIEANSGLSGSGGVCKLSVGNSVFSGCYSLETLSLNNCTGLGNFCFQNCNSLTNINIVYNGNYGDYYEYFNYDFSVFSLGKHVFANCKNLSLSICDNRRYIDYNDWSNSFSAIFRASKADFEENDYVNGSWDGVQPTIALQTQSNTFEGADNLKLSCRHLIFNSGTIKDEGSITEISLEDCFIKNNAFLCPNINHITINFTAYFWEEDNRSREYSYNDIIQSDAFDSIGTENNPCELSIIDCPVLSDIQQINTNSFKWRGGYFCLANNGLPGSGVLSSDMTVFTFYVGNIGYLERRDVYPIEDEPINPSWYNVNKKITKIVFDPSFYYVRPKTTYRWFNGMVDLESIKGLEYLNTSQVTNMYGMFYGCSKLESLDLSTLDTSKSTTLTGMFYDCSRLKDVNLTSFDISAANSIRCLFQNCTSLDSVDLSSFDTSNVSDLRNLFYGCTSLTDLDLSMLVIADGAQTGNMLYNCKALKSLKISSTFGKINSNACTGVGTAAAPCRIYAPEGFSFGTDTSGESFKWKGGYFKLGIDPTISVGDVTAYTGVNAEASLSLTIGHDDYTGYQFDIVLPQGMSLVKTQSGFKYKLSSRFNGDGVSCAIHQQDDGSYRAICYSTNHKTISGTEGVLITFPVVADETVAAGTYTGQIRNFTLNDIGNNSIHVPDVEFALTVLDAATGDVNHDGCVDISDVLLTVDYILGKNPANYIPSDGDINHDGEINISDVLSIVDIILGQNSYNAPVNARTSTVDDLTLLRKDNTYTLCLNNHEPYAGFQMLLTLPEGSTLRNASLVTDRSDGHRLTVRDHGDGTYTLIAYASDGRQLRDNGTPLLRLTVNGIQGHDDVQVKNILFSTLQRETVLLQDVNGSATGIMDIATDNNDTAPVYNTQGQRVSPNYRGLVISGGQKRIRK